MKSKFIGKLLLLGLVVVGGLMYMGCSNTITDYGVITISPIDGTVAVTDTQQFKATCKKNNENKVCPPLTWTSNATGVATIDSGGLATGIALGTATITAKADGYVPRTAGLKVENKITISSGSGNVVVDGRQQFSATCTGGPCPTLTWRSSNSRVATIDSDGLATGIAPGTATITATAENYVFGTAGFTVTAPPTLGAIAITPAEPEAIGPDSTTYFSATCTDTTNTSMTCPTLTWSSSKRSIATINASGMATGVAAGDSTTITASSGGITSNEATLTVSANAPTLDSIAVVMPIPTPSITPGATQQFSATGIYSNTTTQDITSAVTWSSSNANIATINAGPGGTSPGLATGVAAGTATITATLGDKSATSALMVIPTYSVGGTVNLLGNEEVVILQNNGGDNLMVTGTSSSSVPFTFPIKLTDGASYVVTVATQPTNVECAIVSGGSGSIAGADVTNVALYCL